jgi:RNA polymerase sigma-70 factor (ECF subfamily)
VTATNDRALPLSLDRAHRADVLRASRRLIRDGEAEDLAQEALARAAFHAPAHGDLDARRAWLHRVLANLASNRRRWLRVRSSGAEAFRATLPTHTPPTTADPMLRARLAAAVARLSEAQRQVIALVYIDERTIDEAAQAMGCAGGTARSHLHRALVSLRAALGPLRE